MPPRARRPISYVHPAPTSKGGEAGRRKRPDRPPLRQLQALQSEQGQRVGNQLGSQATTGEGKQNILCAYLSLAVLAGLGANALFGLWWADPIVALIVAIVVIQAGVRTWRGQACGEECS